LNRLKIKGGCGANELGTIVACETTLILTFEKGKAAEISKCSERHFDRAQFA
jgi:hypothetical protein